MVPCRFGRLNKEVNGASDLGRVGTFDEASHLFAGDFAIAGERVNQVPDDGAEADHFGQKSLLDWSACGVVGDLE